MVKAGLSSSRISGRTSGSRLRYRQFDSPARIRGTAGIPPFTMRVGSGFTRVTIFLAAMGFPFENSFPSQSPRSATTVSLQQIDVTAGWAGVRGGVLQLTHDE